jgi:hypothetical protein
MSKQELKKLKLKYQKVYTVFVILAGFLILAIYFQMNPARAQNRLDLDDIDVKGELINDDRLVILSREKNELQNYVKFRTNFKSEIAEELPQPKPGVKY